MNTTKLILALAAVAATAVEDKPVAVAAVLENNKPNPSPRSLRGKSAGAIEAKLQNRVGGRQPRMGSYVPPEPLNVYVSDWGTDAPDVVYVDANFMPASKGVFRMKGGGQIPLTDAELVWDPSLHPVIGDIAGADIRAKDGEIWVTTDARLLRLVDMDGDGKYNSEGETLVWLEGAPLDRPKALDVV